MDILLTLLKGGTVTQEGLCPDLPDTSRGLPQVTTQTCQDGCDACVQACPTRALTLSDGEVRLDLGRCLACGLCTSACPSGTLIPNRSTMVARRTRAELILSNRAPQPTSPPSPAPVWQRSFAYRQVSTGDNAADSEVAATHNAIFDASRFGIHCVASPRHADALLVTGPLGRAMQDPLKRCYEAMAEPRIVLAIGASAISGVPFDGGYAEANGVDAILPVGVYVPGHPPHPWYVLHGMLLAMGRTETPSNLISGADVPTRVIQVKELE